MVVGAGEAGDTSLWVLSLFIFDWAVVVDALGPVLCCDASVSPFDAVEFGPLLVMT